MNGMGNKLRHPKKPFSHIQDVGQSIRQVTQFFPTYQIHGDKKEGKSILPVLRDLGDMSTEYNMYTSVEFNPNLQQQ